MDANKSPEDNPGISSEIKHLDFKIKPDDVAFELLNPTDRPTHYAHSEHPYNTPLYEEDFVQRGGYRPGENWFSDQGVEQIDELPSMPIRITGAFSVTTQGLEKSYIPSVIYRPRSNQRSVLAAEAIVLKDEAFAWAEKLELYLFGDSELDLRVVSLYKVYEDATQGMPEARLVTGLAKRVAEQGNKMIEVGVAVALIPKEIQEIMYKYYNGTLFKDVVSKEFNDLRMDIKADVKKLRRKYTDDYREVLILRDNEGTIIPGLRDEEYTEF